jgi:hypothetical protein
MEVHFTPEIESRLNDLTSRPLRFTRVREYVIAYAPEERPFAPFG